jgi:predicted nucleic acid-binding protein
MFLDSSAIVELMRGGKGSPRTEKILGHIENELLFISVIQLGEVNDWCIANCSDPAARISQLKEIVNIIPLNDAISIEAPEIKRQMRAQRVTKFSLMDGFILASARYIGQRLLTLDTDFRKAEDVIIIK